MDYIDEKYVNMIGMYLERFRKVREHVYNFRCPICGDSKKKKTKARGYLFSTPSGTTLFQCKNAGCHDNLGGFIRTISPTLYDDYRVEKFGYVMSGKKETFEPVIVDRTAKHFADIRNRLDHWVCMSEVDDDNPCKQYILGRKIPESQHHRIWAIENMHDFVKQFEKYKEIGDVLYEPGIAIPFIHKGDVVSHIQLRSIQSKVFMTLDLDTGLQKIWGEDLINPSEDIYIFEAAFDAMFIRNSLAFGGVNSVHSIRNIIDCYGVDKVIICFDNDYLRNKDVLHALQQFIKKNCRVLLYSSQFRWKDINAAVKDGGWDIDKINNYIRERTFSGLGASLELSSLLKKNRNQHLCH